MATLATFSISKALGFHPVGQFFPGLRGNPIAATKATAITPVFTQGSPAIQVPTPIVAGGLRGQSTEEHYCLMQFSASVDLVITAPGADPNDAALFIQTVLVPAAGYASYGLVLRPGDNEVHFRSTT